MTAEVRSLRFGDLSEWSRLRVALWPDCTDDMHDLEIREILAAPDEHAVFVIDCGDGRLGGFVEVSIRDRVDGSTSPRVGYVEGWYVEPELRGRGVGRRLVEAAERWSADRGLTEIASDTGLDNPASIAAHRALGFRETFRLVHFLKRLREPHAP